MTTYKESGVNISEGDKASMIAYGNAKKTFSSRNGMIGMPVEDEGGFSGLLDMGNYYLVQNDDGVGTKIALAEKTGVYETLGYDLVAMVADDAICLGAEVISITNTIDADKVDSKKIEKLMEGLGKAATEQKIVIPGGEIAELGELANGYVWNATAVGIVEKDKVINGKDIQKGDRVIGLYSSGFRSNGLSLVRHILKKSFGESYENEPFEKTTYAKAALTPSIIYHNAVLQIHGRYGEKPKAKIKGIAHITGGGIPGNLRRILKKNKLGAHLDNLIEPDNIVKEIQQLGKVEDKEAYETWNMGNGMMIITDEEDAVMKILEQNGIRTKILGEVTENTNISIIRNGREISWE